MIVMVSTDLIQEVMSEYFQKLIPGKLVRIVDSNPTASGFGFSLSFAPAQQNVPHVILRPTQVHTPQQYMPQPPIINNTQFPVETDPEQFRRSLADMLAELEHVESASQNIE